METMINEIKIIQSSSRMKLIHLLASRLVHERDYQKPAYVGLYQQIQKLFDNIFPDPSILRSWKFDPRTHIFEIDLIRPYQKGNSRSFFHFEPKIKGHFEPISEEKRYRLIVEKGIEGSVYFWKRPIEALYLDNGRFYIILKESVCWKTAFSRPLQRLIDLTNDFHEINQPICPKV